MDKYKKIPTKSVMIDQLRQGGIELSPLSFHVPDGNGGNCRDLDFDAMIEVSWQNEKVRFAVACLALSTPKAFRNGLNQLKTAKLPRGVLPILFLPFLSEGRLKRLESEGFSGIDLCGNGVIIVHGKLFVFRTGGKNLFPSWSPIKNIYRKNSSMVGRVFLSCPEYKAVQKIREEINRRNPLVAKWRKKAIGLSTVSKVLKKLEEDLIVSRTEGISLLQPDKLLEKLSQNYEPPADARRVQLKIKQDPQVVRTLLVGLSEKLGLPVAATGKSSVSRYTVMQRGDLLSVYCPKIEKLLHRLPDNRSDRFPNLELIEAEKETLYFDARDDGGFLWASPVQVYMELMSGDKRDQETAGQLKPSILQSVEPVSG